MNLKNSKGVVSLRYAPLDSVALWLRNPKRHDIPALITAFNTYGFQIPPKFEASLNDGQGGLVYGNGRVSALIQMRNEGQPPPKGIALDEAEAWQLPILFGNDLPSQAVAESFAVDHNNLVMAGGGFSALYVSQLWEQEAYVNLLVDLSKQAEVPVTVQPLELQLLLGAIFGQSEGVVEKNETRLTIGMYTQKIPLDTYVSWANALSEQFNYDKPIIITELKRRLGLDVIEHRLEKEETHDND